MESMETKLAPYFAFLASEKERLAASASSLAQAGRQDEANFDKIRLNIVTVFETVLRSDLEHTGSWEEFLERYTQRFTSLPAPWWERFAQARQHGDSCAQTVEEIKLEMTNRLWNAFERAKEADA